MHIVALRGATESQPPGRGRRQLDSYRYRRATWAISSLNLKIVSVNRQRVYWDCSLWLLEDVGTPRGTVTAEPICVRQFFWCRGLETQNMLMGWERGIPKNLWSTYNCLVINPSIFMHRICRVKTIHYSTWFN